MAPGESRAEQLAACPRSDNEIGIHADVAKDPRPTGTGIHVLYLPQALARIDTGNEYLLYFQRNLLGGADSFSHWPTQPNFRHRPVRFPLTWQMNRPRAWWNWRLPAILRRDRVDVFHGPNHFLPDGNACKKVVTIHDLAYFHMRVHGERRMRTCACDPSCLERAAAKRLVRKHRRDVEGLGGTGANCVIWRRSVVPNT